jgi:putative hemolysin
VLELSVIVICLLLNALLSCVEMAFVTVSKPHLRKLAGEGDKLAQKVLDLRKNPERILSVLQIGITLVGAVSAAIGGAGAEDVLGPYYQNLFHVSTQISETLAIITLVLPLTYFSVVIGELVPKTLAIRFPMRFAKFGSFFLTSLTQFFAPLVFLLEHSTKFLVYPLVKRMGSEAVSEQTSSIDLDDLSDSHKQFVLNLIGIDKRKVKDILLPWSAVVKIEKSAHQTEVMDTIRRTRHTRMPVLDEGVPYGILQAKEFISEIEIAKVNWTQLLRPIIFVNAEEPILNALKTLQSKRSHMAIVLKKSEILGIVTLEDIFEEVVGDIYDEDDNPRVLLSSNSKMRQMNLGKKAPSTS